MGITPRFTWSHDFPLFWPSFKANFSYNVNFSDRPGSKSLGQFNFQFDSQAQCGLNIDSHPTRESKLNSHHWRELTGFTWLTWIWDGFFDRTGIQDSHSRCECKARSHGWRECRVGFAGQTWIPRIHQQNTFPLVQNYKQCPIWETKTLLLKP